MSAPPASLLLVGSLVAVASLMVVADQLGQEEQPQAGEELLVVKTSTNNKTNNTTRKKSASRQRQKDGRRGSSATLGKGGKKISKRDDLEELLLGGGCMSLDVCCNAPTTSSASLSPAAAPALVVLEDGVIVDAVEEDNNVPSPALSPPALLGHPIINICETELDGQVVEIFGPGPSFIGDVYCCDVDIDMKELADGDSSCFEAPFLAPSSAGISIGGRFVPGTTEEGFCLFNSRAAKTRKEGEEEPQDSTSFHSSAFGRLTGGGNELAAKRKRCRL